jgi:hypothetical protein
VNLIHDPNLVLYLPLHKLDGSSLMTRDAYGNQSAVIGATWAPQGRNFDGSDDYIMVPNAEAFSRPTITVILWMKFQEDRYEHLAGKWNQDDANQRSWTLYRSTTGKIYFAVYTDADVHTIYTTKPYDTDWHMLAGTYNGSKVRIYYDANLESEASLSGNLKSITAPIYIGVRQRESGVDAHAKALIGDFIINGRSLSPEEIASFYQATKRRYR